MSSTLAEASRITSGKVAYPELAFHNHLQAGAEVTHNNNNLYRATTAWRDHVWLGLFLILLMGEFLNIIDSQAYAKLN